RLDKGDSAGFVFVQGGTRHSVASHFQAACRFARTAANGKFPKLTLLVQPHPADWPFPLAVLLRRQTNTVQLLEPFAACGVANHSGVTSQLSSPLPLPNLPSKWTQAAPA